MNKYILFLLFLSTSVLVANVDEYYWYETDAPYYNSSMGITGDSLGNLYYITQGFLFKSTDNGFHWTSLKDNENWKFNAGPKVCDKNGYLYLAGDSLIISKDYGNSFVKKPMPNPLNYLITDFAIKNDTLVLVYDNFKQYKVYISPDHGNSYELIYNDTFSFKITGINSLGEMFINSGDFGTCKLTFLPEDRLWFEIIDPSNSVGLLNDKTILYFENKKLYSGNIYGSNFTFINDLNIYDPQKIHVNSNCILATDMNKVLYSRDQGKTLDSIFGGMVFMGPPSTEILAPNGRAYIGSEGYGKLLRWTKKGETGISDNFSSIILSPNPASDYIEIFVGAQRAVPDAVSIFDILGIEVLKSMHASFRGNDSHFSEGNIRIDVSGLAPGVYFVRVGDRLEKFIKI